MHPGTTRFLPFIALGIYLFLYAPFVVLIVFSLTPSEYSLRWEGFSLQWYRAVLHNGHIHDALKVSVLVAVASTVVSTGIGTLTALTL